MRLTGSAALEYAAQEGLSLNRYADETGEERRGLTLAEAAAIAYESPHLIWVDAAPDAAQPQGQGGK